MKKLSIVIPMYNEEEVIQECYNRITSVCKSIENYEYEIIFINDGSKDKTLEILEINKTQNIAVLNFISKEAVRLANYLFLEQQSSSFKNNAKLNEFEFSGNNAVKIRIDENTVVSIEGKIDRIDSFGDYIRIIDYKTGETESNLNSIYYGKKIQLVSYLSAIDKIKNNKVAGLLYFPIHSDFVKIQQKIKNNYKMQGFLLDDIDVVKYMDSSLSIDNIESMFVPIKLKNNKETRESGELQISYGRTKAFMTEKEFEDIMVYTEKLCTKAASEILDGNITPSPIAKLSEKESSECSYCDFLGFCGREKSEFGNGRRCGGNVDTASFSLDKEEIYGDKMD
jgi:ATP-dependent helicase/DNAse subunit B